MAEGRSPDYLRDSSITFIDGVAPFTLPLGSRHTHLPHCSRSTVPAHKGVNRSTE